MNSTALCDRLDLDPLLPCLYAPGSEERIETMRRRAGLRLPLVRNDDSKMPMRLGYLAKLTGGKEKVAVVTDLVEEQPKGVVRLQRKPASTPRKRSPSELNKTPETRGKEALRKRTARASRRQERETGRTAKPINRESCNV